MQLMQPHAAFRVHHRLLCSRLIDSGNSVQLAVDAPQFRESMLALVVIGASALDPVFLFPNQRRNTIAGFAVQVTLWIPKNVALETLRMNMVVVRRGKLRQWQLQRGGQDQVGGRLEAEELTEQLVGDFVVFAAADAV